MIMFFNRILLVLLCVLVFCSGQDSKNIESKKNIESNEYFNEEFYQEKQNMQIYEKRRENAIKDMQYVQERELKHTIKKEKLDKNTLQKGINNAHTKKQEELAAQKVKIGEYNSNLYFGIQVGATFTSVADNTHILPTINIKFGYQDFLGISSRQFGLKIYGDAFIGSNILESFKNDPLLDFVDTTFSATNINAAVIFEVNVSKRIRFGLGAGFGIGYMTYHDAYWDILNGFSSNVSFETYLSFGNRNKIELAYKNFFYHYGNYVTRKLENVVNTPYNILSADFAKPMSLSIGWSYVF